MQLTLFGILGVATGSLYGLVALGVVLSYRASGVLNFSAGAVGAVSALSPTICVTVRTCGAWQLAVAAGLAAGVARGALTQVLVMVVLRRASLFRRWWRRWGFWPRAQDLGRRARRTR